MLGSLEPSLGGHGGGCPPGGQGLQRLSGRWAGVFKDDHGGVSPKPAEEGTAGKSAVCASAPPQEKRGHCLLSTFFLCRCFSFSVSVTQVDGHGGFLLHRGP